MSERQNYRKIRVFVASPSDVARERRSLQRVIESLNRVFSDRLRTILELQEWHHVMPDMGLTQEIISQQLPVATWDIFVGILWLRMGTPTGITNPRTAGSFASGTEQEFELAYRAWQETGRPRMLVYRCVRPPRRMTTVDDGQYSKVCEFFERFDAVGGSHPGLYQTFASTEEFAFRVWGDLAALLLRDQDAAAQQVRAAGPASSVESLPAPRQTLGGVFPAHFLQVLVSGFRIARQEGGRSLAFEVTDRMEVLTNRAERNHFFRSLSSAQSARDCLVSELARFDEAGSSGEVSCDRWPLRYANGGALPIVELESVKYVCLFYREVFPAGWNIANGASDNYQEIMAPDRIIWREFGEELLVADEEAGAFRTFAPGEEVIYPGYQDAPLSLWKERMVRFGKYARCPLAVHWVEGPDRIAVSLAGQVRETRGLFVSVTPEDNAIEVDRVAYLALPKHAVLLDGEMADLEGVGRTIGLFRLDDLRRRLCDGDFWPDRLFFEGEAVPGGRDNFEQVRREYLGRQHRRPSDVGTPIPVNPQEGTPELCPITRSIMTRYLAALERGLVHEPQTLPPQP